MFKKKEKDSENSGSVSRTVYTETTESADGVQTKRTVVTTSGDPQDIQNVFKDFAIDPAFTSRHIATKKVVYSTSAGQEVIIDNTTADGGQASDDKDKKHSKSLSERLGFKSKTNKDSTSKGSGTKTLAKEVKPGDFEDDCLKSHNAYRAKHGVGNLKLSKQICAYSQEWADHLAATDRFEHRKERKYGENIYMKWSSNPDHIVLGSDAVDSWYSEIKDYTFGVEPTSLKSGHFTQVIWKESTEMGVAWARSKTGKILVVANYDPPGNFVGRFAQNVPSPKK